MDRQSGFTLIELLICMVILAILISISYPSYQSFIIKSRRTDAQSELIKAQMEQSSYRILQPSYATDISLAKLPTANEHYAFSIVSASTHTYLMKAQAKENSPQNNDKAACKTLFIDQNSTKTKDGSEDNTFCW